MDYADANARLLECSKLIRDICGPDFDFILVVCKIGSDGQEVDIAEATTLETEDAQTILETFLTNVGEDIPEDEIVEVAANELDSIVSMTKH
jgi:glucokinase